MILKFRLFESPDSILDNGKLYKYPDDDAVPFIILDGDVLLGVRRTPHNNNFNEKELEYSYRGRLWLTGKIISFWNYPEPKEMIEYIGILNKKLNIPEYTRIVSEDIDIWDYSIEVPDINKTIYNIITLDGLDSFITNIDEYFNKDLVYNYLYTYCLDYTKIHNIEHLFDISNKEDIIKVISNYRDSNYIKISLNSTIDLSAEDSEISKINKIFNDIPGFRADDKRFLIYYINKYLVYDIGEVLSDILGYRFKSIYLYLEYLIDNGLIKFRDIVDYGKLKKLILDDYDDLIQFLDYYDYYIDYKEFSMLQYTKLKEKPQDNSKGEFIHLMKVQDKGKKKVKDLVKGWKPKQIKYKLPGETEIEAKRRLKNMYQEKKIQ